MSKSNVFLPGIVLLTSLAVASCGSNTDNTDNNESATDNSTINLSFLSRYETNSFDESATKPMPLSV